MLYQLVLQPSTHGCITECQHVTGYFTVHYHNGDKQLDVG
jgi:hypothetical protein